MQAVTVMADSNINYQAAPLQSLQLRLNTDVKSSCVCHLQYEYWQTEAHLLADEATATEQ